LEFVPSQTIQIGTHNFILVKLPSYWTVLDPELSCSINSQAAFCEWYDWLHWVVISVDAELSAAQQNNVII
jgi:hypothetical protein